jgi:RNA polymerase sigma-70 factor (ECF subfamily)
VLVERVAPAADAVEDLDAARAVIRFQGGDRKAFEELYRCYFDRVYAYLRVALGQAQEAEDAAQQVFMQVLEALPRYEQRGKPLRAWLFTIVRNAALGNLQKHGRMETLDPEQLERRREENGGKEDLPSALQWISDSDLLLFVQRLPLAQRQVLFLRFMLDLPAAEIGQVLGRNEDDVRALQSRGLRFLQQRLAAVGRKPVGRGRARIRGPLRQARVARARRWALMSPR